MGIGPKITTDLPHQIRFLEWAENRVYDANFSSPGTGKTRMELRRAQRLFERGRIDALVVLCPNSIKTNWVAWPHMQLPGDMDEVQKHLGDDNVIKAVYLSNPTAADKAAWADFEDRIKKPSKLIIVAVNYEALLSEQVFAWLGEFCKTFRTRIVADESTRLGTPGSSRTKRATKLRKLAASRGIMTGTPILKSPLKIFSQARFLDDLALGYTSFYPFRNRYCIMGGFEGRQVLDFKNLDELSDKIASFSFRVKAEDVLDMPPRDWKKRMVYMTPEQSKAYTTMRKEFFAEVDGTEITATIVLAQMTRLQQITGGYLAKDGQVFELISPARNPKFKEVLEIIEDFNSQAIVWFRFRPELEGMRTLLEAEGISAFEFHGGLGDREKLDVRKAFQKGDRKVLLGITSAGGIGIDEFKVANTVCFVSNDFNTETREQAELRNWRMGSVGATNYFDILVPNTVDMKIIRVLRGDAVLSHKILREEWREWI